MVDPSGLDVLVIEQGPTEGNPVGHTALAITGRGVFSFGNGGDLPGTDNKGNLMGGNLAQYLYRETARRDTQLYVIKTTPAQDAAIEKALRDIAANERGLRQDWRIAFDNCSARSNRGFDAGGVLPGAGTIGITGGNTTELFNRAPGSAGFRAILNGAINYVFIPQGAKWQPASLGSFMRR